MLKLDVTILGDYPSRLLNIQFLVHTNHAIHCCLSTTFQPMCVCMFVCLVVFCLCVCVCEFVNVFEYMYVCVCMRGM